VLRKDLINHFRNDADVHRLRKVKARQVKKHELPIILSCAGKGKARGGRQLRLKLWDRHPFEKVWISYRESLAT